jgi:hypothetical protein
MMKTILSLVLLFSPGVFASTLTFADGALKAELSWLQGPRSPEASEMKIEWKSGVDGTRIEPPGPVKVSLFMPAMGHGSSPTSIAKLGQEAGVYRVSDIYFSMGGDWEVRVNLKYSNGREETKKIAVNVR